MSRRFPITSGSTPHGRVGASSTSKILVAENDAREGLTIRVDTEEAKVYLALGPTAVLGEGMPLLSTDYPWEPPEGYLGDISMITEAEGPNEKQTITVSGAKGGTFTLSYGGKATGAITYSGELTAAEVATALAEITALEGNIAVTGSAGGPFTVEFKEGLKGQDVDLLVADAAELEAEEEETPAVTVATTTKGGISVCYVEA